MGEFDTSVGPLLLGIFLNTYLYGLVTNQYVSYVHHKFNDPRWIKTIVIILFLVDTTHSAVGVYAAWNLCVVNFNNPAILLVVDWTIPFTAVAVSTSGVVTQTFLIHRVFQLTKSKFLVTILAALSTGGFVSGWIAGVRSGILKDIIKFREIIPLVTCWLTLLSSVDLLITAILIFVLARSKTGFRRTDTIINRLIRGAVQTGLFASMFALGDLFSFVFASNTTFYAMFAYPIGRIYTNTLLDTLNARMLFHRMDQESSSGGLGAMADGHCEPCIPHADIHPSDVTSHGEHCGGPADGGEAAAG
ncbi:hypothetical protein MVEN_00785700 [Mycena venus]|uniref:DUF6534 domain-containing protein n=1 Tax=Mycena venus TaxID=2733690 RepID=A0A8H6YLQ3_9AGAR|nr:hypothetical protein MVEN_00785700 [Mycena venus]